MLGYLKNKGSRVETMRNLLGPFANENKDMLIIVADPQSDYMFVAFKDKMVLGKLKTVEGQDMKIVKSVLKQSVVKPQFDEAMDRFLGGMVNILNVGLKEGNQFYTFIADVLFAFQERSKKWAEKKKKVDEVLANKTT